MKIFTNKNLIQKLTIIFVCIFLFNFCIATPRVQAAGGILFAPIKLFLTSIADVAVTTVQRLITGDWIYAVQDDSGTLTEGADTSFWKRKIDFPIIQVSPELIFSNNIELLNIDFISNPEDNESEDGEPKYIIEDDTNVIGKLRTIIASWYVTLRLIAIVGSLSVLLYIGIRIMISSTSGDKAKYKQMLIDWVVAFCILLFMHYIMAGTVNIVNRIDKLLGDASYVKEGIELQPAHGGVMYNPSPEFEDVEDKITAIEGTWDVESLKSSIKNKIIVEVPDGSEYYPMPKDNKTLLYNTIDLQLLYEDGPFIDNGTETYQYKFTDKAINEFPGMYEDEIGTLIVKLNVETVEGEKWVTGGSMTVEGNAERFPNYNDVSAEIFGNVSQSVENQDIEISQAEVGASDYDKLSLVTFSNGKTALISNYSKYSSEPNAEAGSKILYFINYARLYVNAYDTYTAFGYLILYMILIVFLIMFTVRYLKRVIYIAFLTLIAPLVALTYPIDKLRDGKAQAFNMWFREYIFNVMIQPFHLLIYTILVGSALSFASQYMIYAIIAMAFLVPAENLLRSFFGFDKATTLSAAGSFAGGALFSTLINKLNRPKSGGSGGQGGSADGSTPTVRKPSNLNNYDAKNIVSDMMGFDNSTNINVSGADGQDYEPPRDRSDNRISLEGNLSLEEQREKDSLENYLNNVTNEDIYLNPQEYQQKLNRMQELENKQRAGSGKPRATRSTTAPISSPGTSRATKGNMTSVDSEKAIESLTSPIFKPGDKWRIAMGYQKNKDGQWVKGQGQGQGLGSRLGNAVGSAAYTPYRQIANKVHTLPKSAGRLVRKAVVGGVVGGALGTAGLAVGAAAGDPSKAFSLASAGAVAGYYGANHYGDKAAKSVGEVAESARTGFWGEDIDKIEQAKFDDEFSKDAKNIDILTRALGTRDKAKKAIEKGQVQAFLNKGVTDVAKIGKALALMEKNELGARNEADGLEKAVALTVLDKSINHSIYDRTSMHRAAFIEREVEELVESGMKKETATEKVEKILKNLEYLNS